MWCCKHDDEISHEFGQTQIHLVTVDEEVPLDGDPFPGDFHEKYVLSEKLWQGNFGTVYVGNKSNPKKFSDSQGGKKAIKIIDLRNASASLLKRVNSEARISKLVAQDAHCVRLHEVFQSESFCYMVMEKCGSSLLHYLENLLEFNERSFGQIFRQMLLALKHIHAFEVVHRDVRPDNFLVGGVDGRTVKLSDFRVAAVLPPRSKRLRGEYGSAHYMCPEMLSGSGYYDKADVWSVGVIVYVLLFGRYPYTPKFETTEDIKRAVLANGKVSYKSHKHACYVIAFSMELLGRRPEERPDANEALNMFYMRLIKEDKREGAREEFPSWRESFMRARYLPHVFEVGRDQGALGENPVDIALNKMQMEIHRKPISKQRPAGGKLKPRNSVDGSNAGQVHRAHSTSSQSSSRFIDSEPRESRPGFSDSESCCSV